MNTPRPEGFDFTQPDPESERCPVCNPDGRNRTGLRPTDCIGTLTTAMYGVPCEAKCRHGLRAVLHQAYAIEDAQYGFPKS